MGYLEHQMEEIMTFLDREEKRYGLVIADGPEGTLQRTNNNDSPRYVHCTHDPHDENRYVRRVIRHDPALIRSLATKEYARLALKQVERNRHYVESLRSRIQDVDHEHILENMKSAYRMLPPKCFDIDRESPCDWSLQREWARKAYEMSNYKPEMRNKRTSRGFCVRSKSEVLLIEKLYEYEIPFRYEQAIHIGEYELAPDFTFLDRNGEEFYLEYCGMMDNIDYVDHYVWKRSLYESIGISEWKNMIYVYESNNEINLTEIDGIIRRQIISRMQRI